MSSNSKRVRRRACAVIVHDAKLLLVHLRDPVSGEIYATPPGGGIEAGESSSDCALRETLEETGYQIELIQETLVEAAYDFLWNGEIWHCHTSFHLARLVSNTPREVKDADYLLGSEWISLDQVESRLGYHPDILSAVRTCLRFVQ